MWNQSISICQKAQYSVHRTQHTSDILYRSNCKKCWIISPWTKCPPFRRRRFICIFMNEKFCILISILLKFAPRAQLTIRQCWFRQWLGIELATSQLLEPMFAQFTDAYKRHYGEMIWWRMHELYSVFLPLFCPKWCCITRSKNIVITHSKIEHSQMKTTSTRTPNKPQWLDPLAA